MLGGGGPLIKEGPTLRVDPLDTHTGSIRESQRVKGLRPKPGTWA